MADGPVIRFAILGVGHAGMARFKAIRRDPSSEIVAVHGGRRAGTLGVPVTATPEEAIDLAHVVCVCSPAALHADHARLVLERKRHLIVEAPLAGAEVEAVELYALAQRLDRVVHVAHVDLLGAAAATLRGALEGFAIRRVILNLQLRGDDDGVPLAVASAPDLHRVVDVVGPIARIDDVRASPDRLVARLTAVAGAPIELTVERSPYFAPWRFLEVQSLRGTWTLENQALSRDRAPQTLLEATPIFEMDHRAAMRSMLHADLGYLPEERILHVLRLTDRLTAETPGAVG